MMEGSGNDGDADLTASGPEPTPESRVGAAMRAAREQKGLSRRALARKLHMSHSNLSDYERGQRLAPQHIVQAYENEFKLAPGSLLDLWEAARVELFGEMRDRRRPWVAPVSMTQPSNGGVDLGEPEARWVHRPWIIASIALLITLAVIGGIGTFVVRHSTTAPLPPDGMDPKRAGCDGDAETIKTVAVTPSADSGQVFGHLELRYSPNCHSGWPRFDPTQLVAPGAIAHLETRRPTDHRRTTYDYPMPSSGPVPAYGNMLQATHGCIVVSTEVRDPSTSKVLADGSTLCLQPTG
jgi:transcriptional regulator with XRE-family HTH domain